MLEADIDQLKKLADTLDDIGGEIDTIDVRTTGDQIGTALPGCNLGTICAQAGEFTEGAWLRIALRMRALSEIVRQSADDMNTTDQQFKDKLNTMDFRIPGGGEHANP
ncbi:hypothetical protein [Nocardia carnea]|uniref:ESX-1 secretion-associated protein n=1 Tax=Nocardia carnea TaxID=37328 RepID=A0ABW7TEG1_9NOCA|nr:hypothetical protein [Nocardia carnea]